MKQFIFFWSANAFEASATISRCVSSRSHSQGIDLEPAGEFVILLILQMLFSWVIAKSLKKDYHAVNTAMEAVLVLIVLFNWLHTWLF